MPNITGSIKIAGAGQTRDSEGAFSSSYSMSVNEGFEPGWMFSQQGVGTLSYNFNASKGENKTDGTLKTSSEHKAYGTSNFVTPKNITIKL